MSPEPAPKPAPTLASAVIADPGIHSGDLTFRGTRVPVAILLAHLADERLGVAEFREGYPSVAEWQIAAVAAAPREAALRVAVADLVANRPWQDETERAAAKAAVQAALDALAAAGEPVPADVAAALRAREG